jgi:hypothetical protein
MLIINIEIHKTKSKTKERSQLIYCMIIKNSMIVIEIVLMKQKRKEILIF